MDEKPQESGENSKPAEQPVDGTFRLLLSDDQFRVYLDEIIAPENGGKAVIVENVLSELKKQKLTQGVDSSKIEEIISQFNAGTLKFEPSSGNKLRKTVPKDHLCIATGDEPVPGEDGCLIWPFGDACIKHNCCAVLPGELIVTYRPATSGKEGKNVFGKTIPTKPGANNFPRIGLGIETTTSDKGEEYRAQWLGAFKYEVSEGTATLSVEHSFEISDDAMEAYLDIYAHSVSGAPVELTHIVSILEANGIRYGIDEEAIKIALDRAKQLSNENRIGHVSRVLVAKGEPVKEGKDARLVLSRDDKNAGMELSGGRVDFREKNYPWNVKAGDKVGYLLEAKGALDGRLVTGEVIEAKQPKDIEIDLDGLHKDEHGRLIADKDGALIISTSSLYIVDLLEISGSVDQKTGNVHSDIPVHVKGYVDPGFKLESKKEIIIDNNIEDAIVRSGGDVLIKGGIRGMKSEVFAPGEVNVGFIENAKVYINGHLTVRGSIINSEIGSNGDIFIGDQKSKNSTVMGGIITARNVVEAAYLGSPIYAKTIVRVGFSQEVRREFNRLEEELDAKKNELNQLDQIEYRHKHYPLADSNAILGKVAATREVKTKELQEIQKAIEDLKQQINSAEGVKIVVHKAVYPGVVIKINEHSYDVTRPLGGGVFSLDTELNAIIFVSSGAAND